MRPTFGVCWPLDAVCSGAADVGCVEIMDVKCVVDVVLLDWEVVVVLLREEISEHAGIAQQRTSVPF